MTRWNRAEILTDDRAGPLRPCLFLDRDGVLIEDVAYIRDPAQARLLSGAAALIGWARRAGWRVVVVTNQSGVGRGYFDWDAFDAVEARLRELLRADGAALDLVLACGRAPSAPIPADDWRKPGPGMIREAARLLPIELGESWIVGDRARDLAAGCAAGLKGGVLVSCDAWERDEARRFAGTRFAVALVDDLAEARGALGRFPFKRNRSLALSGASRGLQA